MDLNRTQPNRVEGARSVSSDGGARATRSTEADAVFANLRTNPSGMVQSARPREEEPFGLNMIAKYEAQCAVCRGLVEEGEEISYLAPSGDLPAVVKHKVCPEKPIVLHPKDPEELYDFENCPNCGALWSVRKGTVIMEWRCCTRKEVAV